MLGGLLALNACVSAPPADTTPPNTAGAAKPFIVIAHRGASGYRPEHTLAAYQLAIDQGADYIETDLVPTLDGHLIARHENALAVVRLTPTGELREGEKQEILSATTDVAERPEFAHLLRVREIDGRRVGGWFSEDFTLAEIKTLWARERIPKLRPANAGFRGERIPSLQEVLDLTRQPGNTHIGLYPELKHPTYFRFGRRNDGGAPIDIDTAKLLVTALDSNSPAMAKPIYIQCFEIETLRRLRHELLTNSQPFSASVRLVQLFGPMSRTPADVAHYQKTVPEKAALAATLARVYGPLANALQQNPTYAGVAAEVAVLASDYANGLGPRKGDTKQLAVTGQALGLELHPYTVRAEPFFLSKLRGGLANSVANELTTLKQWGATGVFIDQPDLAVRWRQNAAQQTAPKP